jgi:hypothetical protein
LACNKQVRRRSNHIPQHPSTSAMRIADIIGHVILNGKPRRQHPCKEGLYSHGGTVTDANDGVVKGIPNFFVKIFGHKRWMIAGLFPINKLQIEMISQIRCIHQLMQQVGSQKNRSADEKRKKSKSKIKLMQAR